MSIESSFGPLGRKKIYCNSNSIIISKDSQYLPDPKLSEPVLAFLDNQARIEANRRGDGVLSSSILINAIIKGITQAQLEYTSPAALSLAVTILHSVVQSLKKDIMKRMIDANIWCIETDIARRVISLCRTTAYSSSNLTTTGTISEIMENWLIREETSELQLCLVHRLRTVLDHFDSLVHISIGNKSSDRIQEDYMLVPADRIITKGRCSDFSALSSNTAGSIHILCIKQLSIGSKVNSTAFTIQQVTAKEPMYAQRYQSKSVFALVQFLNASIEGPVLLLCSESVSEVDRSVITAAVNIVLVDYVPMEMLAYVAFRSASTITDDANDVLRLQGMNKLRLGKFTHMERTLLSGRNELHYVLCGVKHGHVRELLHSPQYQPEQLVIFSSSTLGAGMIVNILKRCIKVALHSFGEERTDRLGVETNLSDVVIPGGGAAEMGWALLWREVALRLKQHVIVRTSTISINEEKISLSFLDKISPLVETIAAALASRLPTSTATTGGKVRNACIALCIVLSNAFMQLPELLMDRAHDVIADEVIVKNQESNECTGHGSSKHYNKICHGKNNMNTGAISSQVCFLSWKNAFCSHSDRAGRLGIICILNPTSMNICELTDGFQSGVFCSYYQFWDGFSSVLGLVQTYIRIGGETGRISIRGRLKSEEESSRLNND